MVSKSLKCDCLQELGGYSESGWRERVWDRETTDVQGRGPGQSWEP